MEERVSIVESEIASSIGGPVTIDQVEISEVTIPNIQMNNFKSNGDFRYDSCKAKNVDIVLKLSVKSYASGTVDLPWPIDTVSTSGHVNYTTFTEPHSLGDILFDAGKFSMNSPVINMGPLIMKPDPIGDGGNNKITVNEMKVKDIEMKCTEIPLENPFGVYFGSSFQVQNPMNPNDVLIEETKMAKLDSDKISSPKVVMKNIRALNITIPSVTTGSFEIRSGTHVNVHTSKQTFGPGVTRDGDPQDYNAQLTISIDITIEEVIMKINGGLEFTNLKGDVTTESATSDKFDMDLRIRGINIKGLNICGMKIPEIMIEI